MGREKIQISIHKTELILPTYALSLNWTLLYQINNTHTFAKYFHRTGGWWNGRKSFNLLRNVPSKTFRISPPRAFTQFAVFSPYYVDWKSTKKILTTTTTMMNEAEAVCESKKNEWKFSLKLFSIACRCFTLFSFALSLSSTAIWIFSCENFFWMKI